MTHSSSSSIEDPTSSSLSSDFSRSLTLSELTPLSPEVIQRQATVNIGTIGHVAHGKSTVVKAISGVQTVRFKNELERNITIKLGYANAKVKKLLLCNVLDTLNLLSFLFIRFTSVKAQNVHVPVVTVLTRVTRKQILPVSSLVVRVKWNYFVT